MYLISVISLKTTTSRTRDVFIDHKTISLFLGGWGGEIGIFSKPTELFRISILP